MCKHPTIIGEGAMYLVAAGLLNPNGAWATEGSRREKLWATFNASMSLSMLIRKDRLVQLATIDAQRLYGDAISQRPILELLYTLIQIE